MKSETGPIYRGQGEIEGRHRPLQVGRRLVEQARELTYEACLGQLQDEQICAPAYQMLNFI